MISDTLFTIKDAAKETGYDSRQIMYKIRQEQIQASKVGWIWVIPEDQVAKLKELKKEEDERRAKRHGRKKQSQDKQ